MVATKPVPLTREECTRLLKERKIKDTYNVTNLSKEFTDDVIKTVELNIPHWVDVRTTEEKNKDKLLEMEAEALTQVETIFPYIMLMITEENVADAGITFAYQLARNFLLAKVETNTTFLFDTDTSDPEFWVKTTEPEYKLQAFLTAASTPAKLTTYLGEISKNVTWEPKFNVVRAEVNLDPKIRLGFFGMYFSMMLRTLAKEHANLDYLYNGAKPKLSDYFMSFYRQSIPYVSIPMPSKVLERAKSHSKTNRESNTLLLSSVYLFQNLGAQNESKSRVLSAIYLQSLLNFGLPALGWASKAAKAVQIRDYCQFLEMISDDKTKHSVDAIVFFAHNYKTKKEGDARATNVYYPVAKLLDSDYFKELGREMNPEFISSCYLITYHFATNEERARLARFNCPADRTRFCVRALAGMIRYLSTTTTSTTVYEGSVIMAPEMSEKDIITYAWNEANKTYNLIQPNFTYDSTPQVTIADSTIPKPAQPEAPKKRMM